MNATITLEQKNSNLYLPEAAKIVALKQFTPHEKFFRLELLGGRTLGHVPGQFVQLSILGIGEAPISISSVPSKDNFFEICVRAVGDVTKKLHSLELGDIVHIRGPFGHGFDDKVLDGMLGKRLVFIAGGLGYVPLRSLINKVLPEREKYKEITILYGCKTPAERMYKEELAAISQIGENVSLQETVDHPDRKWKGNVGVITTLIPKVESNPQEIIAVIVGPPVMYKFVLKALVDIKVPKENIYLSLERRMKCGVGKCGHCQMGGIYVCQKGPVFNYAAVKHNEEMF